MVIMQVNYTFTGIDRAEWDKRCTDETATLANAAE